MELPFKSLIKLSLGNFNGIWDDLWYINFHIPLISVGLGSKIPQDKMGTTRLSNLTNVTNNNQTTSGRKHDRRLQSASGCLGFMRVILLQRVETLLYCQKMRQLSLYFPFLQKHLASWANTFGNLFEQKHFLDKQDI